MRSWWIIRGRRWATYAIVPLIAVLIGVGVVIGSSSASLTRDHRGLTTTLPPSSPSPSAPDSPSPPTVTEPGIFASAAHIEVTGSGGLAGQASGVAAGS